MNGRRQSRSASLRALVAALVLFIAAVSAPIAVATQSADSCGMACCIKEGHCCCSPHHASVKGQIKDDKPRIGELELSASCPESCTLTTRFSKLVLRDPSNAAPRHLAEGAPSVVFFTDTLAIDDPIDGGSSPPRAPPSFSTL